MEKFLIRLFALTVIAVIVTLSEIFAQKENISKKYISQLLKHQCYYIMTYIIFVIIIILLVNKTKQILILYIPLIIVLGLEVQCFLKNFLIHLKRHPKKNLVLITILESMLENTELLLKCFCEKSIDKIEAIIELLFPPKSGKIV